MVSGNKVEYDGQIMSLSASAPAALHKLGGYAVGACSGSDDWMYEGKTLDEIRIAKSVRERKRIVGGAADGFQSRSVLMPGL